MSPIPVTSLRTPMKRRTKRPTTLLIASLMLALLALPAGAGATAVAKPKKARPASPAAASAPAPAAVTLDPNTFRSPKLRGWINDTPDTGQFLPDSVWLLRVGPRMTTAGDYVREWFNSYPEYRPMQDSTG